LKSRVKVTIPTGITHANQSLYVFDGYVVGNQGQLAKFSCQYCGSGDYVLTPFLNPAAGDVTATMEFPADTDLRETQLTEILVQCCNGISPEDTAVPEPSTTSLVVLAFVALLTLKAISFLLRRRALIQTPCK
jgi:hypothetical protein